MKAWFVSGACYIEVLVGALDLSNASKYQGNIRIVIRLIMIA
ncbi:MAG: hypothetical protein ACJA2D_000688 [Pseudohongiellaceae bacterium]|jgi:hypothetical protein